MKHSTFPRSGVLLLGRTSVHALLPATLSAQVEALLDRHRIQDAADLAEQHRRTLEARTAVDEDEMDELRYVSQRIGFTLLRETRFQDAGRMLLAGALDPRVLASYFPDLASAALLGDADAEVFAGVREGMPECSVDETIATNLVRNYSPHLAPSTRAAPQTAELRRVLGRAARDMLEGFLRGWRVKDAGGGSVAVRRVVDTVLAKLYAQTQKTTELHALLLGDPAHAVVLAEIEGVFRETGQFGALGVVYAQRGAERDVLRVWAKLVDGEWVDDAVEDPLSSMFELLTRKRDRSLVGEWAVWLTKRDPERALKLFVSGGASKRRERTEDDVGLLQLVQSADPVVGASFLEHLVLAKRSASRELHTKLAVHCLDRLFACLEDASTLKLWRAKAVSYASLSTRESFLSYFASTTPESDAKRARLQTVLFLQSSDAYDAEPLRERLSAHRAVLALELAIVQGKLGRHHDALTTLVHDLRDAPSAEAYCTLGDVVPPPLAHRVAERHALVHWAAATAGARHARSTGMGEAERREMVRVLLEVYVRDGQASPERTARLLNSQAMNLDVVDVISRVPPDWPLSALSTFLSRSFRRSLHSRHEGQITKAVSAGENLAVSERTWLVMRAQGAIVEEALEYDDDEKKGRDERVDVRVGDDGDDDEPSEKGGGRGGADA